MSLRLRLFALVAVVALMTGVTSAGKLWAQIPVAVGSPCRTTVTGNVATDGLGVSDEWTVTVIPGIGSSTNPRDLRPHTANGELTSIKVVVMAKIGNAGARGFEFVLSETFNFGNRQVTAPRTLTKSGKDAISMKRLRERIADSLNVSPDQVFLQPGHDVFTINASVTHDAGPLINPPETATPDTLAAVPEVDSVAAADGEKHQLSINLTTP